MIEPSDAELLSVAYSRLARVVRAVANARDYLEVDAEAWEKGSEGHPHRVYLEACAKLRRDVARELGIATAGLFAPSAPAPAGQAPADCKGLGHTGCGVCTVCAPAPSG